MEHSFWNATGTPCEYIEMNAGTHFQQLVERSGESPVRAALEEERYRVRFNVARIPGMLARHRLTSVAGFDMPWQGMAPPRFL